MMENSFEDDDLEGDLNRFCEDMDRELDEISGTAKKESDPKPEFPTPLKRPEEVKKENEKSKPETTVAASPWGMSLFSSFASSATKSMSASFSPLAKDLTSITSLATSATKAFSDTLTGSPYGTPEQKQSNGSGLNDLTSLARTPEALAKLQKIQAEQDLKRSQMTYACLIASRSAREIAVPARSVTEIPVLVPPGKDISWKFQVKHYDILFGVKLRVQQDGSGEWTEHELVPVGMITSDDHIDEGCCSERCARKFIFSLDNNIAMIYSKTVAFDIILTDDDECWREDPEVDEALENNCDNSQDMEHTDVVAENLFGDDCISSDVLPDVDVASAKCIDESVTTGSMEEWTVFHNDDGQPYYYNNYTQECQWEKPDGVETSWSESDTNPTSQDVPQVEDAGDDDDMAALMLKLSRGFKAGHITAEQRQKFMEDIIECRDLGEVHRELNEIFDQSDGSPQKSIPTVV